MNEKLIKSNFYEAVNGSWLESAVIPNDQPAMSAFLELNLGIEKTLMGLTNEWLSKETLSDNLKKYIKLYKMTNDFDKRNELGSKPFRHVLNRLNDLKSLKDLEKSFCDFSLESIEMPFGVMVMSDFMNSINQVLYFGAAGLFLPDTTYYQEEATKKQLIELFTGTTSHILSLLGFTDEECSRLLNEALAFDELLVPVTKSSVENADYVKLYNPYERKDIASLTSNFDLMGSIEKLVKQPVSKMIIMNPDFLKAFDTIISEENFHLIKSWMIVSNALSFASHLTDELRIAGGAYGRALSGVQEAQSEEKFAFYQAYNQFSQVVGLYYGENFFGPLAKRDVESMVREMIEVYKERIRNNDWLNDQTKEKAILKLKTLTVHVGYPEEIPPYYDMFTIDGYENGSDLVLERLKMTRIKNELEFQKYNKPVNRNIWSMPASMVNAYYNPTNNQIVFPAAILQKPYYSLDQAPSENYGGIGAVMAHEISHAFDNNGAKFDETGSLNNWWLESDLEAFNQKAEAMIKLFDGVETGFGACNGTLTVSENIADSGGLRCAYVASLKHKDHDADKFFQNWARVWRNKASLEFSQLLLRIDVHGPSILRANMQLSNMPEFLEFYDIKEEDSMYLDPKKAVSIW